MNTGTLHYSRNDAWETVWLSKAVSLSHLETFARFLQNYTAATLDRLALVISEEVSLDGNGETAFGLREKARVNLQRYPLQEDSTDYRQVVIVAPIKTMFEYDHVRGSYKVSKAAGDEIASVYSALTGIAYIFKDGYLTS